MAEKRYLMTPGPTPAPPEVLAAIAQPVIHHRGPDYRELYARVLARLREVFRTEQEVLLFGGSGSGAMESAVANLCSPGDPVLVVSAGYFGERWAALAKAYGAELDHLRYSWGEIPTRGRRRRAAARARGGGRLLHALRDLDRRRARPAGVRGRGARGRRAERRRRGVEPRRGSARDRRLGDRRRRLRRAEGADDPARPRDDDRLARRLGARPSTATSPRFYWDWEKTRKGQQTLDAPVTPPVSLVAGLDVALGMLLEEGLEAAFDRHRRLGRACREGLKAMGLQLSSPDDDSSAVVTAAYAPDGIDSDELVLLLRDRHGVTLAPGQGELKGKIFRIGHIGYYDVFDITTALAAVELGLVELGAEIERGVAVTRALEAFEHTPV